jgi:hypothetical protein
VLVLDHLNAYFKEVYFEKVPDYVLLCPKHVHTAVVLVSLILFLNC